jgi:predicted secreted protein
MPNVKYRGVVSELWNGANKIPFVKTITITDEANQIDVSDHDTTGGYGEFLGGVKSWKAAIEIWSSRDSNTGVLETQQAALYTAYLNQTVLSIKIRPAGTGVGKAEIQVSARVLKWNDTHDTPGAQNVSFDLGGVGAPVVTVQ